MSRAHHRRFEFVLHREHRAAEIGYILERLRPGYSLADLICDLIAAAQESAVAQPAPLAAGVSDEQRAFYSGLLERLENMRPHTAPQHESTGYTATPDRSQVAPTTAGEIEGGGIDMSRRRPRKKSSEGVTFAAEHLPKTTTPQ